MKKEFYFGIGVIMVFAATLFSLRGFFVQDGKPGRPSSKRVMTQFIKDISRVPNLFVAMEGENWVIWEGRNVLLCLEYYGELTQAEARSLIHELTDELLRRWKANEVGPTYEMGEPISLKHIYLEVSVKDPELKILQKGDKLAYISKKAQSEDIEYCTYEPKKGFVEQYREPYNKGYISQTPKFFPPANPTKVPTKKDYLVLRPKFPKYVNELINKFVDDVFIKYGLTCDGYGQCFFGGFEGYDLDFESKKALLPQEALDLMKTITQDLLDRINSSEELQPYLLPNPFTHEQIEMQIAITNPSTGQRYRGEYYSVLYFTDGNYWFSRSEDNKPSTCLYEQAWDSEEPLPDFLLNLVPPN